MSKVNNFTPNIHIQNDYDEIYSFSEIKKRGDSNEKFSF